MKELLLRYDSLEAFIADCENNLRKARAFVPGADGVAVRERCRLAIVHPQTNDRIDFAAEAVWIGPAGIGVAIVDLDAAARAKLDDFADSAAPVRDDATPEAEGEGDPKQDVAPRAAGEGRGRGPRNLHERMRSLSIGQREELARHGTLAERVALERAFGSVVWEGLLQNPSISVAEVARISRNGTLPKPLVNVIVNNAGWVSTPEVQRALMSNPRCSGAQLERVVRSIPASELTRLAVHCPYRSEVRSMVRQCAPRKQ